MNRRRADRGLRPRSVSSLELAEARQHLTTQISGPPQAGPLDRFVRRRDRARETSPPHPAKNKHLPSQEERHSINPRWNSGSQSPPVVSETLSEGSPRVANRSAAETEGGAG